MMIVFDESNISYPGVNRSVNAIYSCLDLWKGFPVIQTTFQILLACRTGLICSRFSASEGKRKASEKRETRVTGEGAQKNAENCCLDLALLARLKNAKK